MGELGRKLRRFFRFEGVSLDVVLVTAAISYVLQINAIVGDEPLYMIAFYTLLPWIPLALFEGIWKVKNYSMIAVLGLFTVLQVGHFSEHLIQVIQLNVMNGTVACPPPVDTIENAMRAAELGLRDAAVEPSYYSTARIAQAGADGLPRLDAAGGYIIGPAACAVFGQLDLGVVHLVWELVGYFGTGLVLLCFPRNIWLFVALLALSWHALEHLTITYFYYFEQAELWPGFRQLWATVPVEGNIYMAVPAGQEAAMLNFYEAGGRFGLMANNGLFEQLTGFDGMPGRAELHMGYNLAITIPTVIGFLVELRNLRSRYLEMAFSEMSLEDISRLSTKVDDVSFSRGDVILREGDPATHCFLMKEGRVAIYIDYGGPQERKIAELRDGALLGEMGLIEGKPRSATAVALGPVGCLRIDAATFADLMNPNEGEFRSEATMRQVLKIVELRQTT
ncbi:cyclic nucleotide-binding domain-containing protein [Roseibacterium sp. SDUM158017]|uniref:cyclic nucleotide-binding domain-containing protein n=1 Tax=Roseicyclus salinarum TaxID=3036773 RepID=UPI002414E4F7|nr:cyclic nucleotide-binding domain-containing protein [Roseibacterium sp. SDUM158017]MDG4649720.1 cyclic nucleotide-binding domain-containing protein [Roseibacterium sp. SDUM158017]